MNTAYIGLGSNLGNSLSIIQDAWNCLNTVKGISTGQLSRPYRTEPVGMQTDNWFINAAGELKTVLSPQDLLQHLHAIEGQFGRTRGPANGYQDRTLDFDILLFGKRVIKTNDLVVPHPAMQDRLFVMLPLCEIAADVLHPRLNRSISELLASLRGKADNTAVMITEWPVIAG